MGRGACILLGVCASAWAAACTLKTSGTASVIDAPSDAGTSPGDAAPPIDAKPACPEPAPNAGNIVASKTTSTITLDGVLDDWGCTPFVHVSQATSAYTQTNGANASTLAADFAVTWDDQYLYVAVRVTDAAVQGSDPTNPFLNDAIEIYVAGESAANGDYSAADHRYVIDHQNLAVDYSYMGTPPMVPSPPGFLSAAQNTDTGYAIEARIAASALGATALASGKAMGFDLAIDDGDGQTQAITMVWALTTSDSCACQRCCCLAPSPLPFCDTRRFGRLTLQ